MPTQHRPGTPGTVTVLPARADRASGSRRVGSPDGDRGTAQVVYLAALRRDQPDRRSGAVRRVFGITGGWLQAVPTRRQSGHGGHTERAEQSFDRNPVPTLHAERRDPRIATRSADRKFVPAAHRPGNQLGNRKLVLLSQEI